MGANLWLQMTWLFLQEVFLTIFISFLSENFEYMPFLWTGWSCESGGSVTDWKWLFLHSNFFPGENKLVQFICNIPSNSFVLRYQVMMSIIWDATDGLFVIISPVTSCVTTNLICQPSWFWRSTIFFFNCCIHIIVKARFNKVRRKVYKFHCCVIEWSNMSVRVKCRKMFRLSSQRLIRRNPHLAFYFNWNPIFVISTNLLMVR